MTLVLEDDGVGNNVSDMATYATPIFTTKRFAKMKEFVVPNSMYSKMKYGRSAGDKWANYIEDENLRAEVRGEYHTNNELMLTCDLTGASIILRKKKINKFVASDVAGVLGG